jgi:serine/threonine protein phosphatase 1
MFLGHTKDQPARRCVFRRMEDALDLIYAIGDIHGCLDKLRRVLAKIDAHANGRPFRAIFLGDYVDRGSDSRAVVAQVRDLVNGRDAGSGTWQALKGNHEQMMADTVLAREGADFWRRNGGDATLESYRGYSSALEEDARWLAALPTMIETSHHAFVHAGCSADYALAEQPDEVRLWIRGWEDDDHDFGKHIVYGHDARDKLALRPFSSGLDTGACYGGPLSCGVFDGSASGGPVMILSAE